MKKLITIVLFLTGFLFLILPYGYQMISLIFIFSATLLLLSSHRKLVGSILMIVCPLLLFLEIPIISAARTSAPDNVDYLILLGAGVNGTMPSLSLLDRLEAATNYMHANPNCKVIVTGGQGPGEEITEAQAMETYLLRQNIAGNRIIKEEKATNTLQNLSYSLAIIRKDSEKKTTEPLIAVVSSEYHLYRAKICAEKLGYSVYTIAAPTSNWLLKINYFLREAPAVVKAWLTPV